MPRIGRIRLQSLRPAVISKFYRDLSEHGGKGDVPLSAWTIYRLAAYTGARRGELLYLRWRAVDLEAAEVTFGGSTSVVRGQRVEGTTKGGRSRTISIDSDTVTALREHHRQQAEERQSAGTAWNDNSGLVFTTRWGEPLYSDTVSALMAS